MKELSKMKKEFKEWGVKVIDYEKIVSKGHGYKEFYYFTIEFKKEEYENELIVLEDYNKKQFMQTKEVNLFDRDIKRQVKEIIEFIGKRNGGVL